MLASKHLEWQLLVGRGEFASAGLSDRWFNRRFTLGFAPGIRAEEEEAEEKEEEKEATEDEDLDEDAPIIEDVPVVEENEWDEDDFDDDFDDDFEEELEDDNEDEDEDEDIEEKDGDFEDGDV